MFQQQYWHILQIQRFFLDSTGSYWVCIWLIFPMPYQNRLKNGMCPEYMMRQQKPELWPVSIPSWHKPDSRLFRCAQVIFFVVQGITSNDQTTRRTTRNRAADFGCSDSQSTIAFIRSFLGDHSLVKRSASSDGDNTCLGFVFFVSYIHHKYNLLATFTININQINVGKYTIHGSYMVIDLAWWNSVPSFDWWCSLTRMFILKYKMYNWMYIRQIRHGPK